MDDQKHQIVTVDSPGYKGPERRETLVIGPCSCHEKHQRILSDHDRQLEFITIDREKRREHMDERMDRAHNDIYTDIKAIERSKVTNKLFYLYISVYSLLFIAGIVSVYTGMHKNALMFQSGLSDVKVMQVELKATLKNTEDRVTELKDSVKEIKAEIKEIKSKQ